MNFIIPFCCTIGVILSKENPVKIEKITRIEIENKSNEIVDYKSTIELTDSDSLLFTNFTINVKNMSDSVFYWPLQLKKPGSLEWPFTKLNDSNNVFISNNFGLKDDIPKKNGIFGRFNYWVFEPDSLIPIWPRKSLNIHFLDTFDLKRKIKLDFSYQFYIADNYQVKNFKFIQRMDGKRMPKHIFCHFRVNLTYLNKKDKIKMNNFYNMLKNDKLYYFRID